MRDEIGRSKRSHYNLPDSNFTYGKPLNRDNEGAKEGNIFLLFIIRLFQHFWNYNVRLNT